MGEIVGVKVAKARLVLYYKKIVEKEYPLRNRLGKRVELVERTDSFYRHTHRRVLFKLYDELFGYGDIPQEELAEIELTIKQMKTGGL